MRAINVNGFLEVPLTINEIINLQNVLIKKTGGIIGIRDLNLLESAVYSVMLMTLNLNGVSIRYTQLELIKLGLGIADGTLKYDDITLWIEKHKRK